MGPSYTHIGICQLHAGGVNPDASVVPQTLTLAAIHVILGLIGFLHTPRLVHRARGLLASPHVKAWLERTTGVVLIAFGMRVAVEGR
jgi:threonine/homoserine/homoserine lactone efflux protein